MPNVHRSRIGGIALLATMIVACGGGTPTPTGTPAPGQPTPSAGQPTPPAGQPTPAPTAPPAAGGTTVSVTLTGGESAGSYTGTLDPGCAVGFMGEGVWSVNFVMFDGSGPGILSDAIIVYPPQDSSETRLAIEVGIGPLYDTPEYKVYRIEPERSDFGGTGMVEVTDSGATAVLHATGTTADGVGIDMTVNCPEITRGS